MDQLSFQEPGCSFGSGVGPSHLLGVADGGDGDDGGDGGDGGDGDDDDSIKHNRNDNKHSIIGHVTDTHYYQ